jgi:hypothetical protein
MYQVLPPGACERRAVGSGPAREDRAGLEGVPTVGTWGHSQSRGPDPRAAAPGLTGTDRGPVEPAGPLSLACAESGSRMAHGSRSVSGLPVTRAGRKTLSLDRDRDRAVSADDAGGRVVSRGPPPRPPSANCTALDRLINPRVEKAHGPLPLGWRTRWARRVLWGEA